MFRRRKDWRFFCMYLSVLAEMLILLKTVIISLRIGTIIYYLSTHHLNEHDLMWICPQSHYSKEEASNQFALPPTFLTLLINIKLKHYKLKLVLLIFFYSLLMKWLQHSSVQDRKPHLMIYTLSKNSTRTPIEHLPVSICSFHLVV